MVLDGKFRAFCMFFVIFVFSDQMSACSLASHIFQCTARVTGRIWTFSKFLLDAKLHLYQ